jgi:hypothetical protein
MPFGKARAHQNDTLTKFRAEQKYADATTSAKNMEKRRARVKIRRIPGVPSTNADDMPCGDGLPQDE